MSGRPGEGYVMRTSRWLSAVAVLVVAGGAGACTGHGGPPPHRSTTTTVPGPIPVDGWAIAGVTENQFCGGPTREGGCQAAFLPASDTVTVTRDGATVAQAVSGADGRFRIAVAPGTYTVQASTHVMGASSSCAPRQVTVSGPPVPTDIGSLHCTIQAP